MSNANGNYVKFADGTLICTSKVQVSKNAEYGASVYNYPVSFIDYSSIKLVASEFGVTSENNGGFRVVEMSGYTVNDYRLKLLQVVQGGNITLPETGTMFMHGIGK